MSKTNPACDVFLSYASPDAESAADVARTLQSFGLTVFDARTIPESKNLEKVVWEAMAESQALVAVISDAQPSANMIFELGAAQGWNKPVYVVGVNPASLHIPGFLQDLPILPLSRVEEVARAIKSSPGPLTDSEKTVLREEYERIGDTVDELILHPALLSKLTNQFNKRAKRYVMPEELVRTLLRMRKSGALGPTPKKSREKVEK